MSSSIKKHMRIFIPLLCLSFIFSGCTSTLLYFPGTIQEEVDKAVEGGYDGMILHVNMGDNSATYSAGWNNKENQIPAKPNTLFKIGSISKLYIAATAAKLVYMDSLDLDETLVQLIPEVSGRIQYADQITLRMLLQHRSGIPEYLYHPGFAGSDPNVNYMTTIALIYDEPADFEPNKKYQYANTNYLILGEILDRTLGYSHHIFVKNQILDPLNLQNTYSLASEANADDIMSGYFVDGDSDFKLAEDHTRPGGSMVATAQDVAIFLRALIDGTLLSPEEQEIYSSVYRYEHTGWLNGYCSIAEYREDIDAVIVQFVNTSKGAFFWTRLHRDYKRITKSVRKTYSD